MIMKKLLLILLAGVAVGILLAPDEGSKTVKKLKEGLDDIKDKAVDEMNNLMAKGKSLAAKGKEKANQTINEW